MPMRKTREPAGTSAPGSSVLARAKPRSMFRDGYHCLRQSADRGAGVWPPSGQARASGDGPQQFKVRCGQGPIVLGLADSGAHDL